MLIDIFQCFSHLNLSAIILDTCHQLFKAQHLHDTSQHHWPPRSNTLPRQSASRCWASWLRYRKPNNGHHDAQSRRRKCARNHNPAKKEGGLVKIFEEGASVQVRRRWKPRTFAICSPRPWSEQFGCHWLSSWICVNFQLVVPKGVLFQRALQYLDGRLEMQSVQLTAVARHCKHKEPKLMLQACTFDTCIRKPSWLPQCNSSIRNSFLSI